MMHFFISAFRECGSRSICTEINAATNAAATHGWDAKSSSWYKHGCLQCRIAGWHGWPESW
jgi:hypothetical protein